MKISEGFSLIFSCIRHLRSAANRWTWKRLEGNHQWWVYMVL